MFGLLSVGNCSHPSFWVPATALGATAVSLMFERLANPDLLPREVFLSARLLERESTEKKKK